MKKKCILVVEDDEDIQQLVSYNLIKAGFNVDCADSGEEGMAKIVSVKPDLVLLDLMLPGIDGSEICRQLRLNEEHRELPVIMVTARGEDADVVDGLNLGADDYIPKPFSPEVLISRIKAVLRRKVREKNTDLQDRGDITEIHDLMIDPGRHEVTVGGKQVQLTLTEFGILEMLAKRPGWAFSRQQIIDAVRGYEYIVTPRAIDVQVFSLRKKLGETGKKIETVRGIGYRMADN
ncbi:MAG: response regulator transcription factor [Proteobacteria bacterium]|nr:response regulator transcription factor [Pseudomonadota bacterium]MBU1739212.1 response regulator transcription factor [Pseudomonadota bacterium]